MPTCLVHNCETSWELLYFHLLSPLSRDQISFDPHQRIETFIQEKKHIVDFLIKFIALASKVQTDNQHAIFLLKKNVNREIIRAITAYPPTQALKSLEQ